MTAIQANRFGVQFGHSAQKAQCAPKFQGKADGPQSVPDYEAEYDKRAGGGGGLFRLRNLAIGALLLGAAFIGYRHFGGQAVEKAAQAVVTKEGEKVAETIVAKEGEKAAENVIAHNFDYHI